MRRLSGTVLVVLALLLATVTAAPAAQADRKIKVIQHNTDGGTHNDATRAAADWGDVDAITYQELCASERDILRNGGWNVYWTQQRKANRDGTRCAKGLAVASTRELGKKVVVPLLKAGGRTFKLLCARVKGTGVTNTWVCTAHFPLDYNGKNTAPSGTDNRMKVARKITAKLNPWIRDGRRIVMTGDFNDSPGSRPLGRFYKVDGSGLFWEGDQKKDGRLRRNMEPTTSSGRKLDYWFASHRGVDARQGISKLPVPDYDPNGHYVIRGSVVFGQLGG